MTVSSYSIIIFNIQIKLKNNKKNTISLGLWRLITEGIKKKKYPPTCTFD